MLSPFFLLHFFTKPKCFHTSAKDVGNWNSLRSALLLYFLPGGTVDTVTPWRWSVGSSSRQAKNKKLPVSYGCSLLQDRTRGVLLRSQPPPSSQFNRCHHLTLTWNAGCWECQRTNAMSMHCDPYRPGGFWGGQTGTDWASLDRGSRITFHRTHSAFDVSVSSPADSWCFCKSCPIPDDTGGPPKPEKCPARVRFGQECVPSGSPVNSCCHSVCGHVISSLCKLIPTSQFHLKKFSCAELHRVNT